jgi:hypothetical protein
MSSRRRKGLIKKWNTTTRRCPGPPTGCISRYKLHRTTVREGIRAELHSKAVSPHAMKATGGEESSYSFTTSAFRWAWVVSLTLRPRFTPGERATGTRWTGGWVDPRAGLHTEVTGKIICLSRGSKPDCAIVQSVVRHYTDWATSAQEEKYQGKTVTRERDNNNKKKFNTSKQCDYLSVTLFVTWYSPTYSV